MKRDELVKKLLQVEPSLTMAQIAVIEGVSAKHYEQVALDAVNNFRRSPNPNSACVIHQNKGMDRAITAIQQAFGDNQ